MVSFSFRRCWQETEEGQRISTAQLDALVILKRKQHLKKKMSKKKIVLLTSARLTRPDQDWISFLVAVITTVRPGRS